MTEPGVEIERQFLLKRVAPKTLASADRVHRIRQGYLTTTPPAIRVRRIDDRDVMTIKSGGTLERREVEFAIDPDVADQLFQMAEGRIIEKTRYVVGRWEIDVFEGRHEGLLVAELEMSRPDEPRPPFPSGVEVAAELTEVVEFSNQRLAQLDGDGMHRLLASLLGL